MNRAALNLTALVAVGAAFTLVGCAGLSRAVGTPVTQATAVLAPVAGNGAAGTVSFIQEGGDVRVVANLRGLSVGKHGMHIHEFGDCASDGRAAGGHLNPTSAVHGGPDDKERHIGDLGNVDASRTGDARYDRTDRRIALSGRNSIVGRAVVIKARPDNFKTQPGGDAGPAVACGVVGISAAAIE